MNRSLVIALCASLYTSALVACDNGSGQGPLTSSIQIESICGNPEGATSESIGFSMSSDSAKSLDIVDVAMRSMSNLRFLGWRSTPQSKAGPIGAIYGFPPKNITPALYSPIVPGASGGDPSDENFVVGFAPLGGDGGFAQGIVIRYRRGSETYKLTLDYKIFIGDLTYLKRYCGA